jgi:hypothetical protein
VVRELFNHVNIAAFNSLRIFRFYSFASLPNHLNSYNMKIYKPNETKVTQSMWQELQPSTNTLYRAKTRMGNSFWMWKSNTTHKQIHKRQLARGIDTQYACHGLTVGSHELPGGPYTPYANGIDILLDDEFHTITAEEVAINDVITWRDEDGDISHTARITQIYKDDNKNLSDKTRLATKNGAGVLHENMGLGTLKRYYGEWIEFYRDGKYNLRQTPTRLSLANP